MAASDDATLMKVAVFGITISIMCTLGIAILLVDQGDNYDYDNVRAYKNELISFSGESMLNETPWILTHVYTPWNNSLDAETHTDPDGWLFGNSIDYPYLNKSAFISLDPNQKSSAPLTYTLEEQSYTIVTGSKSWANIPLIGWIGESLGFDKNEYGTAVANNWNYTGYRYVFDPVLPFKVTEDGKPIASVKDGSLSLVWYVFNNQEGLSGGLDVYGGDIKLASYSATDIINGYNTASGYATTYAFDFQGVLLTLSIRFNQNVIEDGTNLMQAWSNGDWTMAISSISAGNFLDLENSTSFSTSIGNMINTFVQIYTFNLPSIDNAWMDMILWILCGLPMTISICLIVIRVTEAILP